MKEKKVPGAIFPLMAAGLGALSVVMGPALGSGIQPLMLGAAGVAVGGYAIESLCKGKLDRFFELAHIENDVRRPQLISTKRLPQNGREYHYRLPCGVPMSDVEAKKEAMEQYLHAKIDIEWDGEMVIRAYREGYPAKYPFEVVKTKGLNVCLGYRRDGSPLIFDIETAPHMLIGGTTGGGKSTLLRSVLTSLIVQRNPRDLALVLADFQRVELGIFRRCRHVAAFCSTPGEFAGILNRIGEESARRLEAFDRAGVSSIQSWNQGGREKLRYILVVVDEFGALAKHRDIRDELIVRTAQDRKCGIHYILSTQRCSTRIVDGDIKNNIPVRVCFGVSSMTDSRVILDENGAEKLTEKGVGLLKADGMTEFKGMYLSETEAAELVSGHNIEEVQHEPIDDTRRPHTAVY